MWPARLPLRLDRLLAATSSLLLLGILTLSTVSGQVGGLLPGETLDQNPKERDVTVTATVPVLAPPPVPILIEPKDEALLNSGALTFRWRLQEHLAPYWKQELLLNGETYFFDIPLGDYETDEYKLTFEDEEYALRLKSGYHLEDGDYTWRVRAIDLNNRSTASTTWIFSIDSQTPQLLVTAVEQHETAISSLDATTVPSQAFIVPTRTPTLVGKTESNATVELTVIFPDGRTVFQTATADSAGSFTFVLPALTRGEPVEVRLSAIDLAGNSSALSGIFIEYQPPVLEFPLLPPFLLPEVPIVQIPLELPVFPIPEIPVPPEVQEPVAEVEEELQRQRPYLPWVSMLGFWLYLILLFWFTGSSLRFFGLFVLAFVKSWFLGWKRQPHLWKHAATDQLLPVLGFEIHRTTANDKKPQKQLCVTSLYGGWAVPEKSGMLHTLVLPNRKWKYPISGRFSEVWEQLRELWLYGESFTWNSPDHSWETSQQVFVLPEKAEGFQFVVWSSAKKLPPAWLRYLPRLALLVSLGVAATLLLLAPGALTLTWFVFVLWVLFRDIVWGIPQLWKVYFATPKTQEQRA